MPKKLYHDFMEWLYANMQSDDRDPREVLEDVYHGDLDAYKKAMGWDGTPKEKWSPLGIDN